MLPVIGGGTAVVISDAAREAPSQFWHRLIREKVSFVSCVPSYLDAFIRGAPANASLQHLVLGGEGFTADFARDISRRLAIETITNLYGPTEATIDAVGFAVESEQAGTHVPIGRPLSNYRVYVLDDCLEPVAVGVVGELNSQGGGLAGGKVGAGGSLGGGLVGGGLGVAGCWRYGT